MQLDILYEDIDSCGKIISLKDILTSFLIKTYRSKYENSMNTRILPFLVLNDFTELNLKYFLNE